MFPTGTILTRTEPLAGPHPFNVLKVVGPSPISKASAAEWAGGNGEHIIVTPVEVFGPNEIIPESILSSEYVVTSYPEDPYEEQQKIVLDRRGASARLETPEQAFAREGRETLKAAKASVAAEAEGAATVAVVEAAAEAKGKRARTPNRG